jgi:hypothetical protein
MAASLGGSWTVLWRDLFDEAAVKTQLAAASLIDWKRPYREALVNEWLPTRLGDGTITVAVKNLISPFTQEKLTDLPIPSRWLRGETLPIAPLDVVEAQMQIGAKVFRYDHLGLSSVKGH